MLNIGTNLFLTLDPLSWSHSISRKKERLQMVQRAKMNKILFSYLQFDCLGLVTAGTGIGALSFPPLAEFLMKKFGWKRGMFVFAGIMLSCILFGAIMKPLKPRRVAIKRTITESKYAFLCLCTNFLFRSCRFPIEIHYDRPSLPATGIDSNTHDIYVVNKHILIK